MPPRSELQLAPGQAEAAIRAFTRPQRAVLPGAGFAQSLITRERAPVEGQARNFRSADFRAERRFSRVLPSRGRFCGVSRAPRGFGTFIRSRCGLSRGLWSARLWVRGAVRLRGSFLILLFVIAMEACRSNNVTLRLVHVFIHFRPILTELNCDRDSRV